MKKVLLTTATTLFLSAMAFSQTNYNRGFRLGFGLNGGFPTDGAYDGSVGIDVRTQYDMSRKTSLTLTSGYTHLFTEPEDVGFIPAKLGVKYFFGNQFYAMGEAGAAFGVNGNLDNSLILAPVFGFANKYLDASLRYEHYSDYETDQIALRLAYGFSLKKKK
ncbi:hypothetical protein [Paenimyroides aestuarii]|uniref:Outer membrane protein beta-barrel domain-containing protein n=1 Tax=Paenimyroides aestuarii TaxID=2968490 RepID=A0ABY5NQH2_9FLAO|nr:hypothetical protein [Paenimyroides aestuarii]UUV20814.1 hypothetical protein NPX36_10865 [Paenimyroides aestuarii]